MIACLCLEEANEIACLCLEEANEIACLCLEEANEIACLCSLSRLSTDNPKLKKVRMFIYVDIVLLLSFFSTRVIP